MKVFGFQPMDSTRFQISSGNVPYLRLWSGVCYLRNLPPVGDVGHGVQGGGATLYTTLPGDVLL